MSRSRRSRRATLILNRPLECPWISRTRVMPYRTVAIILIGCVLVACDKAGDEEPASSQGHEENIVTLTKESLEHADIKIEPVILVSIGTTLKAAGRITENQNKTPKASTTLERRRIKVNVDLNDAVKMRDVLGLVQTPDLLGRPLELKAPTDGVIIDRNASIGELVVMDKEILTISDPTDLWV